MLGKERAKLLKNEIFANLYLFVIVSLTGAAVHPACTLHTLHLLAVVQLTGLAPLNQETKLSFLSSDFYFCSENCFKSSGPARERGRGDKRNF